MSERSGVRFSSRGSARFAGQRPRAQRSISAESLLVTLWLQSDWPSRGQERVYAIQRMDCPKEITSSFLLAMTRKAEAPQAKGRADCRILTSAKNFVSLYKYQPGCLLTDIRAV